MKISTCILWTMLGLTSLVALVAAHTLFVMQDTPLHVGQMGWPGTSVGQVCLVALAGVALAGLLAVSLSRSIATPLRELTKVATAMAAGHINVAMPPPRKGEIGDLAAAMSSMVLKGQQAEDELRRLRDDLECRVRERTEELAVANVALKTGDIIRERTAMALRETEEKFRHLAENITDVFWIRSADMQELHYLSPGFERIWGRSRESLHANPQEWPDFILAEDRDRVISVFATLAHDPSVDLEYRIVRPDGEIRWVHARGFQVRDAAGQLIRQTGIVTDITDHKAAELAASQLSAMVESSQDAIIGKDLNSTVISWNQGAEKIFGYTAAEMVGTSVVRLIPTDRRGEEDHILARIKNGESVQTFETLRLTKDGRLIEVSVTASPIMDANGKVVGASKMARDISTRKRAEEATARTLQRLNDAQAVGQIGDWEWDLVTGAITWSRQVFEIVGRDPNLGAPRDYEEQAAFYEPASTEIMEENVARAISTGEVQEYELVMLRTDVGPVVVQARAVPKTDGDGRVVGLFGTIQDISARKRAEAALQTSEQRYHSLFENMVEGYAYCRAHFEGDELLDFTYLEVNGSFAKLTGLQSVVGKRVSELIPGVQDSNRELFEVYSRVARTGRTERLETFLNGLDIWLSINVYSSDRSSFVVVFDNITTRKQAEFRIADSKREIEQLNADLEKRVAQRTEALLAATAEAERANYAKSEFLSRMSHELRTPMNAILGFAQVLETEDGLTAEQRDSVDHILKGGNHLLVLINEVLDITSIDAGRMTISVEPVALQDLVEESVGLLRHLATELKIRLAVIPEETAGQHVLADRQRLKQVLLNLLGNAIKYNRPGGSVTVCCSAHENPAVGSPPVIRLSVKDTGAGLDAQQLTRLFNPFDRLGAEQTRIEGTGLGLVLARRMVEHMGGKLGVESIAGAGSTFWVDLPKADALAGLEEHFSESVAWPAAQALGEKRVLLYVEDNPANVRLVTRILARRPSVELVCAETGALGVKMAREHRPDLILLDLHLPDSHGTEVLAQLASDPRTGPIPVVMLSADAVAGKRAETLAAGARAFITKPVDVRNFLSVVDQFLAPEHQFPAC
jgi:PAS domain S-box-containing protein